MARQSALAWLALAATPIAVAGPACAADLVFGTDTSLRYDSNVGRTEHDTKQDGLVNAGPTVRLREEGGDLLYDLYYAPAYLQYFTETELSTWSHYARGQGSYLLDERTSFTFDDRFYHAPSVVEALIASGGAANPTATFGTEKYLQNDAMVGASHLFTSRLRGSVQLSNSIYDPKGNDRVASTTWGGTAELLYAFTGAERIGGGFGFNQQKYEPPFQPSSRTRFYQVYGTWVHDFDETWNFSVTAGPTLIQPENTNLSTSTVVANPIPSAGNGQTYITSTCPRSGSNIVFDPAKCSLSAPQALRNSLVNQLVAGGLSTAAASNEADFLLTLASQPVVLTNTGGGGSSQNSITYFASASMSKKWRNWESWLTYTRNAGSSSGYGTSNILDTLSAVVVWRPSPLWWFSLTGRVDQRHTATEQSVLVATANPAGVTFGTSVGPINFPDLVALNGLTTVKVNNSDALRDYTLLLYGQRRLTKHLTVYGQGTFFKQKPQGNLATGTDYNDVTASLGVRYELPAIHVPFL